MKKPVCSRCGRALSDSYSIAVGMGPECRGAASRKGAKFPKARYHVSHGRVVFDGVTPNEDRVLRGVEKEKDEKREIVLRVKRAGGRPKEAVGLLMDYMLEKDSNVTYRWCEAFVRRTWKEQ